MNMLTDAPAKPGVDVATATPKPLTPELIISYVDAGKRRAACGIANSTDAKSLTALFVFTYKECFFRATRNNPHKVADSERKKMLEGAIKSAAALCLIAQHIRQTPAHHTAVRLLTNGKKDFFSHHTQRQLHPALVHWLDVQMNDTERKQRCALLEAMRSMFARASQPPKRSKRQERIRGIERKRLAIQKVIAIAV